MWISSSNKRMLFCLFFAISGMSAASAAEIHGVIGSSGSNMNFRVIIKDSQNKKTYKLCPNPVADQVNRYRRMKARISGTMAGQCFNASSYQLTQTASGKTPITGLLKKNGDQYSITDHSSKYLLEKIPKKLKAMENKKVVVELAESLTKKNPVQYNVLFYAPAP